MLDCLWAVWAFILGAVFKIKRYQTRAYGSEDAIIGLRNPSLANLARTNRLLHLWGCPPLSSAEYYSLVYKK